MKTFEELKKEITLKRFIENEYCTMYFQPESTHDKGILIKHFDKEVLPELIPFYVRLYSEVTKWIDSKADVKDYVFLPDLIEVGNDYIIRSYYAYHNHIGRYTYDDESIVPPGEYYGMINTVSYELSEEYDEEEYIQNEENIIHRIIRKSLLGCTSKTFFDDELGKFIIVEPKISLTDLEEWKQLVESKE